MTEDGSLSARLDGVVMRRRILEARLWAENESRPFIEIIMSVRLRERPTWLIKPNGEMELLSNGLCESDKSLIATSEAYIREIHERAVKMVTAYHLEHHWVRGRNDDGRKR